MNGMSRQIAQPSAHYELAPDEALALRVVRGQKICPPNSIRSHRRTGCYMAPSAVSEGVLGLGSGVWIRSPASGLCGRIRARRSLAPPSEGEYSRRVVGEPPAIAREPRALPR